MFSGCRHLVMQVFKDRGVDRFLFRIEGVKVSGLRAKD